MCILWRKVDNTGPLSIESAAGRIVSGESACGPHVQSILLQGEQYLPCFVECAFCGSADPIEVTRNNVRRILSKVPQLAESIKSSISLNLLRGRILAPDMESVRNVVLNLARDMSTMS